MPVTDGFGSALPAIKIAIGAELVYQLTGANLSSPQTAELNAAARAPTIAKWVNLSNAEAVGWLVLLTVIDGTLWFAFGGVLAGAGMWAKYRYAIRSGIEKNLSGTEDYS